MHRDFAPHLNVNTLIREGYEFSVLVDRERPIWAAVEGSADAFTALADGTRTVRQIARAVAEECGVEQAMVEADAVSFFEKLEEAGFFEERDESGTAPVGTLFFHLTDRCNLACNHCYVSAGPKGGASLPAALVRRYIDELIEIGGSKVILSGGEPLIRDDFADIVRHIGGRIGFRVLTNGTLLDEKIARLLKDGDCKVQVSLDGSTADIHDRIRGAGAFDGALRAVRVLQEHGMGDRVFLSTVVQAYNQDDLEAIARLAHGLGVPLLRVLPMRQTGRGGTVARDMEKEIAAARAWYDRALFDLPEELPGLTISPGLAGLVFDLSEAPYPDQWCPAGRLVVVTPTGGLYPCALLTGAEYRIGNAHEMTVSQIRDSPVRARIMADIRARRDRIDACAGCTWKPFCQAGCPAIAAIHTGTTQAADAFCEYRIAQYDRLVFELAARREKAPGLMDFEEA